jgi:hypothetical protein
MKITKQQLKKIILNEFKETVSETSPSELSLMLSDLNVEININYDDSQSFLEKSFAENQNKNLINESLRDHIKSLFKKKEKTLTQDLEDLDKQEMQPVDDFDEEGSFTDSLSKGEISRRNIIKTGLGLGALAGAGAIASNLDVFDVPLDTTGLTDIRMPYANPSLRSQAYDHPILVEIERYLVDKYGNEGRFIKIGLHPDVSLPDVKFPDPGPVLTRPDYLSSHYEEIMQSESVLRKKAEIYKKYADKIRELAAGKNLTSGETISAEMLRNKSDEEIILIDLEFEDINITHEFYDLQDSAAEEFIKYSRALIHKAEERSNAAFDMVNQQERFLLNNEELKLAEHDEYGLIAAAKILGKSPKAVMCIDMDNNIDVYREFFELIEPKIDESMRLEVYTQPGPYSEYSGPQRWHVVEIQGKKIIYFQNFGNGIIYF